MMLLLFALVILYCVINVTVAGITQNRLIESNQNDIISRRLRNKKGRGMETINDFQGDNAELLGVVLISCSAGSCTGSYLNTPKGKYVLTAGHCVFNKEFPFRKKGHFFDINTYSVEFGVTKGSNAITTCKVEDIRVNDEYPSGEGNPDSAHDYAVLKLSENECNPPKQIKRYTMKAFPETTVTTKRAGYTATRTLTLYHEKRRSKLTQQQQAKLPQINYEREFGGDSGGPVFDDNYNVIGVTSTMSQSGDDAGYRGIVKLKSKSIELINKYISGEDGISPKFKHCKDSKPSEKCWTDCKSEEPPKTKCYSNGQKRELSKRDIQNNIPQIRCNLDKTKRKTINHKLFGYVHPFKHKYLCDSVKSAADSTHLAHFDLKNVMEMLYDYFYYDDDIDADYYNQ